MGVVVLTSAASLSAGIGGNQCRRSRVSRDRARRGALGGRSMCMRSTAGTGTGCLAAAGSRAPAPATWPAVARSVGPPSRRGGVAGGRPARRREQPPVARAPVEGPELDHDTSPTPRPQPRCRSTPGEDQLRVSDRGVVLDLEGSAAVCASRCVGERQAPAETHRALGSTPPVRWWRRTSERRARSWRAGRAAREPGRSASSAVGRCGGRRSARRAHRRRRRGAG
jgi:hypothetical protein